jgi:RNA polymerase sigma-70 factor (ECF subfamily)
MTELRMRTTDPEDPTVVAAAQVGDRAAQAVIFAAYKQSVARWIVRMTRDGTSVDDLVQEVFIAAFAALPRFRGEAKLRSWLRSIATNHVRNWWDSQNRRQQREWTAYLLHGEEVDEPPDVELENRRQRERLCRALESLPHSLREAFVARTLAGMDLREASVALKVPLSTVSWRARRAEAMLCEFLEVSAAQ